MAPRHLACGDWLDFLGSYGLRGLHPRVPIELQQRLKCAQWLLSGNQIADAIGRNGSKPAVAIAGSFASPAWRYPPTYYELDGTVELKFIASGVVCNVDIPTPPRYGMESGEAAKGNAVMNKDQVQNGGQRARQPRTGWAGMNSVPDMSQDSGSDRQTPPLHILIVEDELLPAMLVE